MLLTHKNFFHLKNDFGPSTSKDNRIFLIKSTDDSKIRPIKMGFFVKATSAFTIPLLEVLKINSNQICPETYNVQKTSRVGTRCAHVTLKEIESSGRLDGSIIFYPQFTFNGLRIDMEFDSPAWALGVSLL